MSFVFTSRYELTRPIVSRFDRAKDFIRFCLTSSISALNFEFLNQSYRSQLIHLLSRKSRIMSKTDVIRKKLLRRINKKYKG